MLFLSRPLSNRLLMLLFAFATTQLLVLTSHVLARQKSDDETPVFREYRGVQLGMSAADARQKLGNPKDKSDEQDFFVFGENETVQVVYNKSQKVVTVSVDFLSGAKDIPTPKIVFGADIEAKADGSMFKLVRYEKSGYWVSYSKTAGAAPLISVTMQTIQ